MSVKPIRNYKLASSLEKLQKEFLVVEKGGGGGCSCSRNTNSGGGGRCCCGSGRTFGGNR